MIDTPSVLRVERRPGLRVLTLQRPAQANALDPALARALADAAAECDADPGVKAVVLTGSGRFFCAGGDLAAMAGFGDAAGPRVKSLADDLHRAISTFARMPAPLIVAVNGTAAGAGFSLAITGDLVLASEGASFTMTYTRAGLSPDGSSTHYLPRLVGLRRAQELMFTNRTLSAPQAVEWGLIHRAVPAETLMDEALRLAEMFVQGAAGANAAVKQLLMASAGHGLETQMELEGRAIAACLASADGREGLRAFLEKRAPNFAR